MHMAYQSRKRNYVSRREKMAQHGRNIRLFLIFLVVGLVVLVYKNRHDLWFHIQNWFR